MSASNNQLLQRAIAIRKGLTRILQWVVIILMALLVFDVLWGVISRYALGQQAKWSEELARLLLVWVSLFGASVAFGMKAHLGLDYFAGKLEPSARKLNSIIGALITLVFAVLVFGVGGWALVQKTMDSGQTMVALPLAKWWEYAAVPVSGIFMVIFLLEQLVEVCLAPVEEDGKEAA
ncbi:TRAP transporter small permease [Pelagicoccus sp. NFK12]|uniref:TRAP transporter small permease n=1 Tax=Pelagicoccus enzymogenes TaxID=2773457 RepID=A0A927IHU2_9BACT|nr:TRAP transporter small permease [Pelagicoccus enzymogenes]MBD5780571.1 TRAP transporter small permease [Pelagicoccus enzymogenes]MDQ8199028.1 TRAP transporter small permease [Pelagicoccus enzymogenes]